MAAAAIGIILIILVDLIPCVRKRDWRQAAAFMLFFLPAVTILVLTAFKIEVPSVILAIRGALQAIGLIYGED